ncbi:MAG TPA: SURF1 family protein [Actinomycetota bacterium]
MRRSLLTPRWIAFTVFALVVVGVCTRLGFWQLERLEGRRYFNERFRAGMAMPAVPIEPLVASDERPLSYRRASANGRYDPAHEVILYGRALDGRPGNHVLTPLVLADGRAVLIDRGWVPFDLGTPPVDEASPPQGQVDVVGFLSPDEPGGADDAEAGDGDRGASTFTRVDLDAIGRQLPYDLLPWYLVLQDQTPSQPGELPGVVPQPTLDEGSHLSYAFQWFAFAAIGAIGYVILGRRQMLGSDVTVDVTDDPSREG